MSKSGQRGYTEEAYHPYPHSHARNSSIKDPNYFGREHSISHYRSRNSEASLFPDVEPKFSHRVLDEYVENTSERNQYRSKADEIGQLENRLNIMEDIMMGDKNEVTRRLIIIEEQLKGFTNFKNNYEKNLEQGTMSSSSAQRFDNVENAIDHIERKLDRVSIKVKEVIKYLNEKVSDRNSKHTMILDEMKKMSDTLVSCMNAQTRFKTELDSIKRDEVNPRPSTDPAAMSIKRPYILEDDKLPTHDRHASYIDDVSKPSHTVPSYRDEERETSMKLKGNKHRLTEPAKQESEVQKVDHNKLSSKRLEQRSKTQEKLERYKRMKDQSRKSEHEISNIENLATEPPKERRLEGREVRENKINHWRQSGQLIANDYATFGEAGRKENFHRHRDDDSWILHKSSEHTLHTDQDISHEKTIHKSQHHHHQSKSGRTREPLTAREHNRYPEGERNRLDSERGSHGWHGGIKKYEESNNPSQHDIPNDRHQKKRISSSTLRPRDNDLLKYNYTQTNETGHDLLADYLEDHHSHPHSHHDGMIRAKSNVPHCG